MPEDWKTGIVEPVFKKNRDQPSNYREIMLLETVYKAYTKILRKRLEKEIEEKGVLSEASFRKGKSTMDNVFILNHSVQRAKEKRRNYALFIDLKVALTLWIEINYAR